MENTFSAADARMNFGAKGSADRILKEIERISKYHTYTIITDYPLTVNQKEELYSLNYKIKDCNFFQRVFLKRYNTIHW